MDNRMKVMFRVVVILSCCWPITSVLRAQNFSDTTITYPMGRVVAETMTTSGLQSVSGDKLEDMPAGDMRSRLTGQIPGFMVNENAGGYWGGDNFHSAVFPSGGWSYFLKGRSTIQFIVDDMRVPFTMLMLDPCQIESVTLISDVTEKARLGAIASDGAVYVKTRAGQYNTPLKVHASVESGIGMLDVLPEWVDGFQYAKLNNSAKAASGYTQMYDPVALEGFMNNDPFSTVAPNVDYKGLMLRSWRPVLQESVRITGGSKSIKYNAAISGLTSRDITRGHGMFYNRINISAGLGAKLTRDIELNLSYNTSLSFREMAYTEWNDYRDIPSVAYPKNFGAAQSDGEIDMGVFGVTRYGVSKTFEDNPYALLQEGGRHMVRRRSSYVTASLDIDLGFLLSGLKSKTYFSYLSFLSTDIGKRNDYLAYYWDPIAEGGYSQISVTHQGTKGAAKSVLSSSTNMALQFYERLSWDFYKKGHKVNAGATFLLYNAEGSGISYRQRQMYGVIDAVYNYKNRYAVEVIGQYVGSHRFAPRKRFVFLPSIGAAWTASNEAFLRQIGWIDKLKLRVQCGLIGNSADAFGEPYLYQSNFAFGNSNYFGPYYSGDAWFGTNRWMSQATTLNRFENSNLQWSKELMTTVGLDFGFLNGFSISAEWFRHHQFGLITDISKIYPSLYGISTVKTYANNDETTISGLELSIAYAGKSGDFRYGLLVSALNYNKLYKKLADNVFNESYQDKIGTSVSAIWGFRCLGRYKDIQHLSSVPAYSSDAQVGDLYYEDINKDGNIDNNDMVILGDTNPALRYFINLCLGWRKWDLTIIGSGVVGADVALTNEFFWNGWGDGNYSAFVRDNIGGAYPRLSYVKSDNNFTMSDFWLTDGTFFKIKDVILSYSFPKISLYLKGQNLLTFCKMKYVDPENINSGVTDYPMFRTVTVGVKMSF